MKTINSNNKIKTVRSAATKKAIKPTTVIQCKLKVGKPNDHYEQEANRVADKVVSNQTPSVQRQCPGQGEEMMQMKPIGLESITPLQRQPLEEEEEMMQPKLNRDQTPWIQRQEEEEEAIQPKENNGSRRETSATSWVESGIKTARGGGSPLPNNTRSFMETRFGTHFDSVRIHTNNRAAQMNNQINAQAFTSGNDIFFNRGKYSPGTQSGKRLLAHELTHTIQQNNRFRTSDKVQRDLAVAPSSPDAEVIPLTPEQVTAALHYNLNRFSNADELQLIRDVMGLTPQSTHLINEDFVRTVGRWQATHSLDQDGKLGRRTVRTLVAEYRGESTLVPEMREQGRRLNIRTKSNERRNNIDVNGHNDLFDAVLSHRNALLTLLMRINFRFYPDSSGTAMTTGAQNTFIRRFRRDVRNTWASMYALIPRGRLLRNYLDTYYAGVNIVNTATNPHFTAHITRTASASTATDPPGVVPSGGPAAHQTNRWLRLGSRDVGMFRGMSRGGFRMRQRTAAHEFGHMIGLNHIHCNTDANACYGTTRTERANIMGLNNRVTTANYLPWVTAMRVITGSTWRAR